MQCDANQHKMRKLLTVLKDAFCEPELYNLNEWINSEKLDVRTHAAQSLLRDLTH